MATHLAVSGTATSGSPVNKATLKSWGAADIVDNSSLRQHSEDGTSSNNFNGGAIVTDVPGITHYCIIFIHDIGGNPQYWRFASASARNSALTAVTTELTTDPAV